MAAAKELSRCLQRELRYKALIENKGDLCGFQGAKYRAFWNLIKRYLDVTMVDKLDLHFRMNQPATAELFWTSLLKQLDPKSINVNRIWSFIFKHENSTLNSALNTSFDNALRAHLSSCNITIEDEKEMGEIKTTIEKDDADMEPIDLIEECLNAIKYLSKHKDLRWELRKIVEDVQKRLLQLSQLTKRKETGEDTNLNDEIERLKDEMQKLRAESSSKEDMLKKKDIDLDEIRKINEDLKKEITEVKERYDVERKVWLAEISEVDQKLREEREHRMESRKKDETKMRKFLEERDKVFLEERDNNWKKFVEKRDADWKDYIKEKDQQLAAYKENNANKDCKDHNKKNVNKVKK